MPEVPGSILGGYGTIFIFFLVERISMIVKKFLSVAKMASTVYETDTSVGDLDS